MVFASVPLREGRLRRWHFALVSVLDALSAYQWFGLTEAGFALLGSYAHGRRYRPPKQLVLRPDRRLWMSAHLLVIPIGWGRCHCLYRDELRPFDFARLRRALKQSARQSSLEPLDLPRFDRV